MKADRSQIVKIKIAQKQLGIDNETKLQQYSVYGVTTCKDLNYDQADELISKYKTAGFKPTSPRPSPQGEGVKLYGWGKNKYTELDKRGKPFAHSSKLRMIEALWREVSNTKTDKALCLFIQNRTGINDITFLHDEHAKVIITALTAMKRYKHK